MEAAKQMLERLQSSRCGKILSSMEKLSDAYIKLAYWDVSQYKKETSEFCGTWRKILQACYMTY